MPRSRMKEIVKPLRKSSPVKPQKNSPQTVAKNKGGRPRLSDNPDARMVQKLQQVIDKALKALNDPKKLAQERANSLATLVGIAIDKQRLLQGKAVMTVAITHEDLTRRVSGLGNELSVLVDKLPPASRNKLQAILRPQNAPLDLISPPDGGENE